MNYLERQQRLRESHHSRQASILVTDSKNVRYLCGFTGSSGWLLLTPQHHYVLTDGRYWEQVGRQCPQAELLKFEATKHKSMAKALFTFMTDHHLGSSLAVETANMTLTLFRQIQEAAEPAGAVLEEVENLTKPFREIKDEEEIKLLQKAADIADRALRVTLKNFAPGRTEFELKAELEYQILLAGGEGTSFSTIVASGPNGSFPHAGASERAINEGELITIDFGAIYRGYCSDMTRTIWYGQIPDEALKLLRHTRIAQQRAVEAVKAGISCKDLDQVARGVLEEAGLAEYFVHSLGHGVGLDVHEDPGVRSTNDSHLRVGQVITVEPGVYVPGFTGCRVEDTVVVQESGCLVLNQFPKQPLDSIEPSF